MADHARIAGLAYGITQALEAGKPDDARLLTTRLADEFERHSRQEEAGLLRQVRVSGEGTEELDRLEDDHRRLRSALGQPELVGQPERLRAVLQDLTGHAQLEDNDFFPFVLQSLPDKYWEALAAAVPER
jgi:hypothetical protein